MTRFRGALLLSLALLQGACASIVEPEVPGQTGKAIQGNKEVVGIMYRLHAPWAETCLVNGGASWKLRDGGYHDFMFTPGVWSNPSFMQIDCRRGKQLLRDKWRLFSMTACGAQLAHPQQLLQFLFQARLRLLQVQQ